MPGKILAAAGGIYVVTTTGYVIAEAMNVELGYLAGRLDI